jgi:hypothetical protein
VYALVNTNYQGDAEHGDAVHDGDSDSLDDNPQADYACDGVYSSRTYWLKCRFEETETAVEAMEADENGTAFRRDEFPRYHLDGVELASGFVLSLDPIEFGPTCMILGARGRQLEAKLWFPILQFLSMLHECCWLNKPLEGDASEIKFIV